MLMMRIRFIDEADRVNVDEAVPVYVDEADPVY